MPRHVQYIRNYTEIPMFGSPNEKDILYVYTFPSKKRLIKIGYSSKGIKIKDERIVVPRIEEQTTGFPEKPKIILIIFSAQAAQLEKMAHYGLRDRSVNAGGQEWFDATVDDVLSIFGGQYKIEEFIERAKRYDEQRQIDEKKRKEKRRERACSRLADLILCYFKRAWNIAVLNHFPHQEDKSIMSIFSNKNSLVKNRRKIFLIKIAEDETDLWNSFENLSYYPFRSIWYKNQSQLVFHAEKLIGEYTKQIFLTNISTKDDIDKNLFIKIFVNKSVRISEKIIELATNDLEVAKRELTHVIRNF